jgi:zinc transporter 1/2/3
MEAGILFHSILIGLTLVVAGDSFYKTLLVVIIFHQFFEGLAHGTRIALLPKETVSFWRTKFPMALAFALITPLGMAIGVGVMHQWNGNDRSTIIAIGTLDAVSAGILVRVGVVDMWARDWIINGGEMTAENAGFGKICLGLVSLVAGFVGMSVLGKWA